MSHAIRDRLMASVRIDAINGDGFERSVVRGQILEAISYIDVQAGQIITLKAALIKECDRQRGNERETIEQLAQEYPDIFREGKP